MSALYKEVFKTPFLKLMRKAKDYISTDECFNPEVQQKTKSPWACAQLQPQAMEPCCLPYSRISVQSTENYKWNVKLAQHRGCKGDHTESGQVLELEFPSKCNLPLVLKCQWHLSYRVSCNHCTEGCRLVWLAAHIYSQYSVQSTTVLQLGTLVWGIDH